MKFPPYSYVLTEKKLSVDLPDNVEARAIEGGLNFYWDKNNEFAYFSDVETGGYVALLGLVVDLLNDSIVLTEIAQNLLKTLLESESLFFDYLDLLSGRYVVIYRQSRRAPPYMLGDATNMLKVNYSNGNKISSSNIFLIDELVGGGKVWRKSYLENRTLWKYGSLGDLSPIEGVKILTPNHRLNLNSYEINRFYPRAKIQENSNVCLIAGIVYEMFDRQQSLLEKKYNIYNSLTAGLDSRFTLAVAKKNKDKQIFFTYLFNDAHLVDAQVASKLAKKLGLNHKLLVGDIYKYQHLLENIGSQIISVDGMSDSLIAMLSEWDWYGHGNKLVGAYRNMLFSQFSERPCLHVRSNLFEIGQAFWGGRAGECRNSRDILEKTRKDWAGACDVVFNDYFDSNEINSESVFGLDLLDVFYWEHRCGTWVSEVLQATDFAFNTHSYVNCRKIIEYMLSLKFNDRVDMLLFKSVIAANLPEIEDVPINMMSTTSEILLNKKISELSGQVARAKKIEQSLAYKIGKVILSSTASASNLIALPFKLRDTIAEHKRKVACEQIESVVVETAEKKKRILPNIYNVKFDAISNLKIPLGKSTIEVDVDGLSLCFFSKKLGSSDKLVVLFPGATTRKIGALDFQRFGWADDFEGCDVIAFTDPTISLDNNLKLGWFQAREKSFGISAAACLIKKIMSLGKYDQNKLMFFGSSGGGFVSLKLAGIFPQSVVVAINPQFYLHRYSRSHFEKMLSYSYFGLSENEVLEKYSERLSVNFSVHDRKAPAFVFQNVRDLHHVKFHLHPFISVFGRDHVFEGRSFPDILQVKAVNVIYYDDEDSGHSPPKKSETMLMIQKVMATAGFL